MAQGCKILFIFPKWPEKSLWGQLSYKFPPLGLLTIAGVTPEQYDIDFVDENVQPIDYDTDAQLIALSVMTPLAPRAYEIGDAFRKRGKTVVMGGIHVSLNPDEAGSHADAVVAGEAEQIWPLVLEDHSRGQLKAHYCAKGLIDLSEAYPPPRRDLLATGKYLTRSTIQLMRGCPFDCEFCSVTAFSGRKFRHQPLDAFVADYRTLPDRFVFIVDDNLLAKRSVAMDLFDRLRGIPKWWGSQVTISVADNEELLKKMAACGCKSLFIGFESLNQENLDGIGKKFIRASKNADRIKRIQDHGIGILGSFIVGLDHDDASVFEGLYDFITANRVEAFLINVLTPFPGTHLTRRLEREGRILSRDWSKYDMNTVLYRPRNFSPEELQARFDELNRSLYSWSSIARRTLKPRKNMLVFVPQNLGYRKAWKRLSMMHAGYGTA